MASGNPVCVIAGDWRCVETGAWKFECASGIMARSIIIKEDMDYKELCQIISSTFAIDTSRQNIKLSFWSPEVSNACTQTRLPPVSLESDTDFLQYKKDLEVCRNLSILMTFSAAEEEVVIYPQIPADGNQTPNISQDQTMVQLLESIEAMHRMKNASQVRKPLDAVGRGEPGSQEWDDEDENCSALDRLYTCIEKDLHLINEHPTQQEPDHIADTATENQNPELVSSNLPTIRLDPQAEPVGFDLLIDEGEEPEDTNPDNRVAHDGAADENTMWTGIPEGPVSVNQSEMRKADYLNLPLNFNNDLECQHGDRNINDNTPDNNPEGTCPEHDDYPDENLENKSPPGVDTEVKIPNDPPPDLDYLPRHEDEEQWYIGRVFANKGELKHALAIYALERRFGYYIDRSDRSRVVVICKDRTCGWRIYACGFIDSPNYQIRTVVLTHTCGVSSRLSFAKKATRSVLADLLQPKFAHGKNGPRACEIPEMFRLDFNVNISYMKAWHAKELALQKARGNDEENYKLLSAYMNLLVESNPDTLTNLEAIVDDVGHRRFKYLFFAMGSCIHAYPFLRKVVAIDGTQLKGKFKGTLVAASTQDGNMQVFPLAFGVVDSENDNSWIWFLENLKKFVPDDGDLVFVSDRHNSISTAVTRVFPYAEHTFCIVHLHRNVKSRFKCEGLASTVNRAARAYTRTDFDYYWAQIESRSSECASYLQDIGLSHWTRYHCPGDRYNIMSSNISESLNAALKKADDYPIIAMIEFIRTMLMRWFSTRRDRSIKCATHCTPEIEAILVNNLKLSGSMEALPATHWIYQVNDATGKTHIVDLEHKSCTCLVFDKLKIPCPHAAAAREVKGIDIYQLVHPCYKTTVWEKVYERPIMPVPNTTGFGESIACGEGDDLLPPRTRRPPGRPKRVRIPSQGEFNNVGQFKTPRCGRCSQTGHNRKTCKASI